MRGSGRSAAARRGKVWRGAVVGLALSLAGLGATRVAAGSSTARADATLAPGALDPSFGSGGMLTTTFAGADARAGAIAIDTSGRIVVGGFSSSHSGDFAVARYTSSGALDSSFGSGNGTASFDFSGDDDVEQALAVDPHDGRIALAGETFTTNTAPHFALQVVNANGTPDTAFGTAHNGQVTTSLGTDSTIFGVAFDSQGRIVVAGYAYNGTQDVFALARYNPDGSLDTTFGPGGTGTVLTPIAAHAIGSAIAIDSQGRIVVAGTANATGGADEVAIARYGANGTLDSSFAGGGTLTFGIGTTGSGVNAMAVDTQGRVVLGGFSEQPGGTDDLAVMRVTASGSLDRSFGQGGSGSVTAAPGQDEDPSRSIGIDAHGRIVYGATGSDGNFDLVRYNTDGSPDTTFNGTGEVTAKLGASAGAGLKAPPAALAVDPQDRIVLAGTTGSGSTSAFALARYIGDAGSSGGGGSGGGGSGGSGSGSGGGGAATRTVTAPIGNRKFTLSTAVPRGCLARSARLSTSLTATTIAGSGTGKLRLVKARFFIDRGIRRVYHRTRHRHGKTIRQTIVTYSPNRTATALPADVSFALRGLRSGSHALSVKLTFDGTVAHRTVSVTRTLHQTFRVC